MKQVTTTTKDSYECMIDLMIHIVAEWSHHTHTCAAAWANPTAKIVQSKRRLNSGFQTTPLNSTKQPYDPGSFQLQHRDGCLLFWGKLLNLVFCQCGHSSVAS